MKRIISIFIVLGLFLAFASVHSCKPAAQKADSTKVQTAAVEMNTLTDKEKAEGWVLLFDGKTATGWRGYNKPSMPDSGWVVENGTLRCVASGKGEAGGKGGDIVFDKKFKNFELSVEWKISPGGNSGIFYLGQEIPGKAIWASACEYQVLDNDKHPDGRDSIHRAGSLYDLIGVAKDIVKPVGEWNLAKILVYQGTVEHSLNGKRLFQYHLWTPEWYAMVAKSKFPSYNPNWAKMAESGFIGLQDHGNDVWFRNIKIKETN
jgi:Domain of Unknown Function (DUF1080)